MFDFAKGIMALLVILSILVVVHEFGHFYFARLFKMRVEDFSIFFGKVIWRITKRGDTEYNVRTWPIGGFVRVAGMEMDDISAGKPVLSSLKKGDQAPEAEMDAIIAKLNTDNLLEIDPKHVGPTVRALVAGSIDPAGRITQAGQDDMKALLESPKTSADEQKLLQLALSCDAKQDDPGLYCNRPIYQRTWVIFGGPLASLLFGYFLFCALYMTVGEPVTTNQVETLAEKGVAQTAGLKSGDRIISINGIPTPTGKAVVEQVSKNGGIEVTMQVESSAGSREVKLTPKATDVPDGIGRTKKAGRIGIAMGAKMERRGFGEAIVAGTTYTVDYIRTLLGTLFSKAAKDNVGGPIAMGQMAVEVQKNGFVPLVRLAAFFSLSLGIINLMPIPILDGGHLMFLALEKLRRRKLSTRELYRAQMVGFGVLMLLFVFVMINDISKLVMGR